MDMKRGVLRVKAWLNALCAGSSALRYQYLWWPKTKELHMISSRLSSKDAHKIAWE